MSFLFLLFLNFIVHVHSTDGWKIFLDGGYDGYDYSYGICIDQSDGSFAIAGYMTSYGTNGGSYDFVFSKFSHNGTMIFVNSFGTSNDEYTLDLILLEDGNYLIAGQSNTYPALVKVNSATGDIVWQYIHVGYPQVTTKSVVESSSNKLYTIGTLTADEVMSLEYNSDGTYNLNAKGWNTNKVDYGVRGVKMDGSSGMFVGLSQKWESLPLGVKLDPIFGKYDFSDMTLDYLYALGAAGDYEETTSGILSSTGRMVVLATETGLSYFCAVIYSVALPPDPVVAVGTRICHSSAHIYAFDVAESADGGFVIVGMIEIGADSYGVIIKVNADCDAVESANYFSDTGRFQRAKRQDYPLSRILVTGRTADIDIVVLRLEENDVSLCDDDTTVDIKASLSLSPRLTGTIDGIGAITQTNYVLEPNVVGTMTEEANPPVGMNMECWSCYGYQMDDTENVCSNHGDCKYPNGCFCDDGYFPHDCSLWNCYNTLYNESSVCSGNGTCSSHDNCTCDPSYSGDECEYWDCDGKAFNDPQVCSGHGSCVYPELCECDTNYSPTGQDNYCTIWSCHGTQNDDSSVCNFLNGTCSSFDNCTCNNGYSDVECDHWQCNLVDHDDLQVCSGHGKCLYYDFCECDTNYSPTGQDGFCNIWSCYSFQHDDSDVCNFQNGTCSSHDNCTCNEGYSDPKCDYWECDGKAFDNPQVCSGHGNCLFPDFCQCDTNYSPTGQDNYCNIWSCYTKQHDDSSVCNFLNGTCSSYNNCTCSDGYSGNECDIWECDGKPFDDLQVCSGHGKCLFPEFCDCETNYSPGGLGSYCQLWDCHGKQNDDSSVCNFLNGTCSSFDNCTCNDGYSDLECDRWQCNLVDHDDSQVCSGHGDCLLSNFCECETNYSPTGQDNYCNLWNCHGTQNDENSVCNFQNGTCSSFDNCTCNDGYSDVECDYWECDGKAFDNPQVCFGHGICLFPNFCDCDTNYSPTGQDNYCTIWSCYSTQHGDSSVCNFQNGTCSSHDNCTCNEGYSGNECEIWDCDGKAFDDPQVCSGHGNCLFPDFCDCEANYSPTGQDNYCTIWSCHFTQNDDTSVCNFLNGTCSSHDNCTCNEGYSDPECDYWECSGVAYNDSQVCSGHGKCLFPEFCQCETNYSPEGLGNYCQLWDCHGKQNDDTSVCNYLNGTCSSFDNCTCNDGYSDVECDHWQCNLVDHDDLQVCSGHGDCLFPNLCECDTNYSPTGQDNYCNLWNCHGTQYDDSSVCNFQNGTCSSFDNCTCDDGYSDFECDYWECDGKAFDNPQVCSGHGNCLFPDFCQCDTNYSPTGQDNYCNIWSCYSTPHGDSSVCNFQNGTCSSHDNCTCNEGYSGNECDIWDCDGKAFDDPQVCSGHGNCLFPDFCDCETNYSPGGLGNYCQLWDCHLTQNDDSSVCNYLNGTCSSFDNCTCNDGYSDLECDYWECSSVAFDDPQACSGHGECIFPNFCECDTNDYSPTGQDGFCNVWSCFLKQNDDTSVCNFQNGTCSSHNNCTCNEGYSEKECDYWECNGIPYNDPQVCSGHGDCLFPNLCECDTNYSPTGQDNYCTIWSCHGKQNDDNSVCNFLNGTCSSFDNCTCNNGYSDLECDHWQCNLVDHDDLQVCSGHGNCLYYDFCECETNYFPTGQDNNCNLWNCHLTQNDDSSVCNYLNGTCSSYNNCTCNDGYSDVECDYWECDGKAFDNPQVCSGHGICLYPNFCECETDYSPAGQDSYCNIWSCFLKQNDESSVCNFQNGTCSSHDNCTCDVGYSSDECDYWECDGKPFNDSEICNGHGNCLFPDFCICETNYGPGGLGNYCQLWDCHGKPNYDTSVCNYLNGTCSSFDNCTCDDGYSDLECDRWQCDFVDHDDSQVCSGHGECLFPNFCECETNYSPTGQDNYCNLWSCHGTQNDDTSVCNFQNGTCSSHDNCTCNDGYNGTECEIWHCGGVRMDDYDSVCTGNGSCFGPDYCVCHPGYFPGGGPGQYCESFNETYYECYGKGFKDSDVCNFRNGTCSSHNNCTSCNEGYNGTECEKWYCGGVLSTNEANVCGGHGSCLRPEECFCDPWYVHDLDNITCIASVVECYTIDFDSPEVCNYGNGTCSSFDNCTCNPGYSGSECDEWECDGLPSTDPSVCSGRGECVILDTCQCDPNYSPSGYENYCNSYQCYSMVFDSPDVCNFGNGTCDSHNNCTCREGYYLHDCGMWECDSIPFNDTLNVCHGRGSCVSPDICSCDSGYFLPYCEDFECGGIMYTSGDVCNFGNGTCVSPDECACDADYYGEECEVVGCHGELSNDTENVCSGVGKCVKPDTCECEIDFILGSECEEFAVNFTYPLEAVEYCVLQFELQADEYEDTDYHWASSDEGVDSELTSSTLPLQNVTAKSPGLTGYTLQACYMGMICTPVYEFDIFQYDDVLKSVSIDGPSEIFTFFNVDDFELSCTPESLCDGGNRNYSYEWVSVDGEVELPDPNARILDVSHKFPFMNQSSFRYEFVVFVETESGRFLVNDTVIVTVQNRDLVLSLSESSQTIQMNQQKSIFADCSDPEDGPYPLSVAWKCVFVDNPPVECVFSVNGADNSIFTMTPSLEGDYLIEANCSSDYRLTSSSIVFESVLPLEDYFFPHIWIDPITDPVNPSSRLVLEGNIDQDEAERYKDVELEWTCPDLGISLTYPDVILSVDNTSLILIIAPYILADRELTTFYLTGSGEYIVTATASITVRTNFPPRNGTLEITPEEGFVIETIFEMKFTDWDDPDQPLLYKLEFYNFLSESIVLLEDFSENDEISVRMPLQGCLGTNYTLDLVGTVRDRYGATTSPFEKQIVVYPTSHETVVDYLEFVVAFLEGGFDPLTMDFEESDYFQNGITHIVRTLSIVRWKNCSDVLIKGFCMTYEECMVLNIPESNAELYERFWSSSLRFLIDRISSMERSDVWSVLAIAEEITLYQTLSPETARLTFRVLKKVVPFANMRDCQMMMGLLDALHSFSGGSVGEVVNGYNISIEKTSMFEAVVETLFHASVGLYARESSSVYFPPEGFDNIHFDLRKDYASNFIENQKYRIEEKEFILTNGIKITFPSASGRIVSDPLEVMSAFIVQSHDEVGIFVITEEEEVSEIFPSPKLSQPFVIKNLPIDESLLLLRRRRLIENEDTEEVLRCYQRGYEEGEDGDFELCVGTEVSEDDMVVSCECSMMNSVVMIDWGPKDEGLDDDDGGTTSGWIAGVIAGSGALLLLVVLAFTCFCLLNLLCIGGFCAVLLLGGCGLGGSYGLKSLQRKRRDMRRRRSSSGVHRSKTEWKTFFSPKSSSRTKVTPLSPGTENMMMMMTGSQGSSIFDQKLIDDDDDTSKKLQFDGVRSGKSSEDADEDDDSEKDSSSSVDDEIGSTTSSEEESSESEEEDVESEDSDIDDDDDETGYVKKKKHRKSKSLGNRILSPLEEEERSFVLSSPETSIHLEKTGTTSRKKEGRRRRRDTDFVLSPRSKQMQIEQVERQKGKERFYETRERMKSTGSLLGREKIRAIRNIGRRKSKSGNLRRNLLRKNAHDEVEEIMEVKKKFDERNAILRKRRERFLKKTPRGDVEEGKNRPKMNVSTKKRNRKEDTKFNKVKNHGDLVRGRRRSDDVSAKWKKKEVNNSFRTKSRSFEVSRRRNDDDDDDDESDDVILSCPTPEESRPTFIDMK